MFELSALRRFATANARAERCELCGATIGGGHPHVLERGGGVLRCACGACAILFRDAGAGGGRFRTVPERVVSDGDPGIGDGEWAALGIPVRLAFVVKREGWTGFFPSAAGPTSGELPAEAWNALAARQPLCAALEPEIESLLILRGRDSSNEWLLAPIDVAWRLAATVRQSWRGISGGDEGWAAVAEFFGTLRARARPLDGRRR
jgi:hypothetical protein